MQPDRAANPPGSLLSAVANCDKFEFNYIDNYINIQFRINFLLRSGGPPEGLVRDLAACTVVLCYNLGCSTV